MNPAVAEAAPSPPSDPASPPTGPVNYLAADRGARSWLFTLDHKRIGLMFIISVLVAFFLGGIFALVLRLELGSPEPNLVGPNGYNRLFTLHGVIMIFLFMIPAIPSGFGNFLLPLMVGAKDVAFPRLNLLSLYLYWTGALLALGGMVGGGADTGWTFYVPYSTSTPITLFPVLLGVFIIGFSSILTGLNFIVTIHTLRAPGLGWMRMPLFVWALYATSAIQILATPVLGLTVLLVAIERVTHFGIFDITRGGDPVLFQHLFWFYSHPAVYIMVLPAMGVVSETITAAARKNIFGYRMIAYSSLGIAFVGFFAWGHHMFVSGQSTMDSGAFAVISMLVGVFTAIKIFNWVGTLYKGAILVSTPFIYICGFLFFLVFGGMTGIAVATVSLDVPWHDTYFVVAHFHFIMVGAVIMAFLAGLHYWFPKMFGRVYHEGWGMVSACLIVLGFNATFIPQFLLGNAGMPRRYFTYPPEYLGLNVASTAGSSLLGFGFVVIFIYLVYALVRGRPSGPNPWNARSFEWLSDSPPIKENFVTLPNFDRDPYDYSDPEETRREKQKEGDEGEGEHVVV
jgi:cytochrome c oxidase subunit I